MIIVFFSLFSNLLTQVYIRQEKEKNKGPE